MNDGFQTTDIAFAAGIAYVFGQEALTKIEVAEGESQRHNRQHVFIFDTPSLECEEYFKEFNSGTFAISDLRSYITTYNWITKTLGWMHRNGNTEWISPSWVRGRKSTGEKLR